jgi:nicotinate-nucleotide adenylyltransferase
MLMPPGRRVGLLGGSFNPAHRGHLHISREALRLLDLDAVWWLVSPGNPLKPAAGMASLPARLASARAMAARWPRIHATAIEAALDTRFTVETIHALKRLAPRRRFIWLMGADNLASFDRWRRWRAIASAVPIAVFARAGYHHAARIAPAMGWLRRFERPAARARHWADWSAPAITLLPTRLDPSSATAIRAANPGWAARPSPAPGDPA